MARDNDDTQEGKMSRQEAGKMGGEATLKKHGPEFYSEIGKQQDASKNPGNFANRPKEEVREAGRHGGERGTNGDEEKTS